MSRFLSLSLLALLVLPACKRRAPIDAPVAPTPNVAPAPEPTSPVDALTPPPTLRPDFAIPQRADTLNGHPNGPKQAEFEVVQLDGQRRLQTCLDGISTTTPLPGGLARLSVKYEITPEGKTKDVSISGEFPAGVASCAKTAIETLSFPKFEGPSIGNGYNLTYSRPQPRDLSAR